MNKIQHGISIITDICDAAMELQDREMPVVERRTIEIPWDIAEALSDMRVIEFCGACASHVPFVAHLGYRKTWNHVDRALTKLNKKG